MDADDARLGLAVARAKEGDSSAVHYLYVRFSGQVHGYVRSIVRNPHDAEDVTHAVFAKMIPAIRRYERRSVPFAAWLMRIARNTALDHMRAQRQVPVAEVLLSEDRRERDVDEDRRHLIEALGRLPLDQRQVLMLRHIAGLSPGEIADRLSKSESAVHGLHHRARGRLQATLTELGSVPQAASICA
jgi:RNA polymerase sigma-70 factor (ECF subfamily)